MPVFISHKDVDSLVAVQIERYLKAEGIQCYLDVLDNTTQSTADITDLITRRISECTHLLAIISDATKSSWWVPFEIGEATYGLRRITSYKTGEMTFLPEYLRKWPVMSRDSQLKLFVRAYKLDKGKGNTPLLLDEARQNKFLSSNVKPDLFHSDLKASILKGY